MVALLGLVIGLHRVLVAAASPTETSLPNCEIELGATTYPINTWLMTGVLYHGLLWQPECMQMRVCNNSMPSDDSGCITALVRSNKERVDTTCIEMPHDGDEGWNVFRSNYGPNNTRYYQAGDDYTCATYYDSICEYPTHVEFTNTSIAADSEQCLVPFFDSFMCWPSNGPKPDSSGKIPVVTSTSTVVALVTPERYTAGNLSVPIVSATPTLSSAIASVEASLQGYFDPFRDDLLLCGTEQMDDCFSYNSSGSCISLEQIYYSTINDADRISSMTYGATGLDISCEFYSDSDTCGEDDSTNTQPGSLIAPISPTPLQQPFMLQSDSFKCWNTICVADAPDKETYDPYTSCVGSLDWRAPSYSPFSKIPLLSISTSLAYMISSTTPGPSAVTTCSSVETVVSTSTQTIKEAVTKKVTLLKTVDHKKTPTSTTTETEPASTKLVYSTSYNTMGGVACDGT